MTEVTEEMLSAYLDGELEPAEAARVATLIAANADLSLRLARRRKVDGLLREAAPEVPTPDYDPLVERILGEPPARPAPGPWIMRPAPIVLCLVAAALIGAAVGHYGAPAGDLQVARAGLLATGALARALDRQPSSPTPGAIRVAQSFRASDARFCREFVLRKAIDGLACHEETGWRVVATAEPPKAQDGYRTAGGEDGPLDRAIGALNASPMAPADEARAIEGGWR